MKKMIGKIINTINLKRKETAGDDENITLEAFRPTEKKVISTIAILWSIFQLYTAIFGTLAPLQQRGIFLCFTLVLSFLIYNHGSSKEWIKLTSYLLALLAIPTSLYPVLQNQKLMYTPGLYTNLEILISIIVIFLILESCRRVVGKAIPIVSSIFLLYAIFGHLLPYPWGHKLYPLHYALGFLYYSLEGIFGIATQVATNYIFLFVAFGVFYGLAGGGDLVCGLASALMGKVRGGPAKIAVIASCLFGTISGSASANVVATGSITIPLMKKIGYRPMFAGAVEATASSGGHIMPPVMGGAAFVMAEMLGVPYLRIVIAALFPALLYYWSIFTVVDLQAGKRKLSGLPEGEQTELNVVLKKYWPNFIPIFLIIFFLTTLKQSPQRAALMGIASSAIIIFFSYKGDIKHKFLQLVRCLEDSALRSLSVSCAGVCVGIIVGVIMLSGIGSKIGSMVINLSGGNIWLVLFFAMIASLILGMGLPVTVSYLIVVFIVIRPLIDFGLQPLAAHMFALFFAVMSNVTPPFALAAVTAAGLAETDPIKTGYLAFAFVIPSFVVAFSFISRPALLLIGNNWWLAFFYFVIDMLGVLSFSIARTKFFVGEINQIERLIFFVISPILLFTNKTEYLIVTTIIFILFTLVLYVKQKKSSSLSIRNIS